MKTDSNLKRAAIGLAALSLFAAASAGAQGLFDDAAPPKAEARLVAGWEEAEGLRLAGLVVDLAPGWKTYWRKPGEAGIPPSFDWSGSENLAGVEVIWPAPVAFHTFDMLTIGYKDRMTLPLRIAAEDPSRPVRLSLALFYGLCEDICIPARADLSLEIAPGAAPAGAAALKAALEAAPAPASGAARCAFDQTAAVGRLETRIALDEAPASAPIVVAEGQDGLWFGPMEARIEGEEIVAAGSMEMEPGLWIDRGAIRLTLIGDGGAAEILGCPAG
ncbi:MAG: protein-disulfide reductase DsbD domain-containing protein [Pikeienuella sp.]|uniref:protein-disulfide reductase DsbD domain-containing protein n=1 Tax=Pikeienuella sp. TaxID=2831957 RepID=UPI00391D580A